MSSKADYFTGSIKLIFIITIILAIVQSAISLLFQQGSVETHLAYGATALISLAILYVPDVLKTKNVLLMPKAWQVFFSAFVFCAMFLGEILDFYTLISWWDILLHFSSGVMFGIVGYYLFISLNRDREVRQRLNPLGAVLFSVFFSIACGAVWEIFEFAADSLIGANMQRWQSNLPIESLTAMINSTNNSNPGLVNTMKDIIADTFGALFSVGIILPLVSHNNTYCKTKVSVDELLSETQQAFSKPLQGKTPTSALSPITRKQDPGSNYLQRVRDFAE